MNDRCPICDRPECDRAVVPAVGGPVPACAGQAVDWRTRAIAAERLLSDERTAHAETSHNLDALLTALGAQVTPGGQTMDACEARRVADGMRLARELVAAREVPADVEAAIRAAVDGAVASGEARALRHASLLTGEPFYTEPRLRAAIAKAIADAEERGCEVWRADALRVSMLLNGEADGRNPVERALRDLRDAIVNWEIEDPTAGSGKDAEERQTRAGVALMAAIAAEIERARAEGRAESPAAPATVGGLLATAPAGSVVEWMDDGSWYRYGDSLWVDYWSTFEGRWLPDDGPVWPSILRLPARLVPASEADADPATRGPIGGGR